MRKPLVLLILVHSAFSAGCGRATPAGFWSGYRPELIEQKHSDQGPWGGVRWISWAAQARETFRVFDVVQFAESKGWSCREPRTYAAAQMAHWRFAGQAVFSLHFGRGDREPDDYGVKNFPRFIGDDSVIVECKTGWIRVDPGSGASSDALGYIQIEQSGRRMAIYHLWGEI